MYALFKGKTQLAGTFATEQEALKAALSEGLVGEVKVADESGAPILPADFHIEAVEEPYDPQPDWKLPTARET